jgi:hypothetical protein
VKSFNLRAVLHAEQAEGMTGEFVLREDVEELLVAVADLGTSTLEWHRSSGPFWRVCRAALKLRGMKP